MAPLTVPSVVYFGLIVIHFDIIHSADSTSFNWNSQFFRLHVLMSQSVRLFSKKCVKYSIKVQRQACSCPPLEAWNSFVFSSCLPFFFVCLLACALLTSTSCIWLVSMTTLIISMYECLSQAIIFPSHSESRLSNSDNERSIAQCYKKAWSYTQLTARPLYQGR